MLVSVTNLLQKDPDIWRSYLDSKEATDEDYPQLEQANFFYQHRKQIYAQIINYGSAEDCLRYFRLLQALLNFEVITKVQYKRVWTDDKNLLSLAIRSKDRYKVNACLSSLDAACKGGYLTKKDEKSFFKNAQ